MELETASVIIALLSAAVASFAGVYAYRAARDAASAAERQNWLTSVDISLRWHESVRTWTENSIAALSEAIYAAEDRAGTPPELVAASRRSRLSALVEQGRLLFPNQQRSAHGQHKLPAYRGFRHAVLDPLVAAERVCSGELGAFNNPADALREMRRHFVSAVELILDPQKRSTEIATLVHGSAERPGEMQILRGATALLNAGPAVQDHHRPEPAGTPKAITRGLTER